MYATSLQRGKPLVLVVEDDKAQLQLLKEIFPHIRAEKKSFLLSCRLADNALRATIKQRTLSSAKLLPHHGKC